MFIDDAIVDLVRETLIVAMKIVTPILLAGIAVGLVISIFQSITSIQDQTLTFVPKILVMVSVAVILLPWIVRKLIEYSVDLFTLG